jgi:hypothetical protein
MMLTLPDHLLRMILGFSVPKAEGRRWVWLQHIMGTCRTFRQIASEHFIPTIFDDSVIFLDLLTLANAFFHHTQMFPQAGLSYDELLE